MAKVSPEEQAELKKSLASKKGKGKGKRKIAPEPEPVLTRKSQKTAASVAAEVKPPKRLKRKKSKKADASVAEDEPPKGLKRKKAASELKSTSTVDVAEAKPKRANRGGRGRGRGKGCAGDEKAYGCARCRFAQTGCSQCKRPGYTPRGPRSGKAGGS